MTWISRLGFGDLHRFLMFPRFLQKLAIQRTIHSDFAFIAAQRTNVPTPGQNDAGGGYRKLRTPFL